MAVTPTIPPPYLLQIVLDVLWAGRVEFDVLDAGLAAVSFALFSKSRRTALIELASPCNC